MQWFKQSVCCYILMCILSTPVLSQTGMDDDFLLQMIPVIIRGANHPAPCGPTQTLRNLADLINQARSDGKQCGSVNRPPVASLSWNCELADAARVHSQDMSDNNFFSHTGSDGSRAGDRISRVGYTWVAWGENIAYGYPTASSVMTVWLNSSGHCNNIMNSAFTEMGAAKVGSQDYWTLVLARPR